jgi:hypothetical protein
MEGCEPRNQWIPVSKLGRCILSPMNQEVPPGDMLFGSFVLVIFLVFVFGFGFLLNRFKNRRFTQAWRPLVPLINGKIIEDGGGAATSWLSGTYRGQLVRAAMVPNRNRYSGESGHRYNHFEIALLEVPGRQDWRIEYKTPILGFGKTGWQIETDDAALRDRLLASGVIDEIARMGPEEIRYQARAKTLLFSEDVTPLWVPASARFQEELELLLRVAKVNGEVNPA